MRGRVHIVGRVGVGLAVEQHPHHLEVAELGGLIEARAARLHEREVERRTEGAGRGDGGVWGVRERRLGE